MLCPSCDREVEAGAWICPHCDFILDPSVLGAGRESEPTSRPVWSGTGTDAPEAMILGDVDIDPEDFQVLPGAAASEDGRTSTFLFYTSGATSRVLRPDVVPTREASVAERPIPTTPYEDFILAAIDGRRTVREIQRSSGLAPQEVTITLLTLIDKKVIRISAPRGSPPPAVTTATDELPVAKPRSQSRKASRRRKSERRRADSEPATPPAAVEAGRTAPVAPSMRARNLDDSPPVAPSARGRASDAEPRRRTVELEPPSHARGDADRPPRRARAVEEDAPRRARPLDDDVAPRARDDDARARREAPLLPRAREDEAPSTPARARPGERPRAPSAPPGRVAEELPPVAPTAFAAEDVEEVTEWNAMPAVLPPAATTGDAAEPRGPEPLPPLAAPLAARQELLAIPKLSSALFASASAQEQARVRTFDDGVEARLRPPPMGAVPDSETIAGDFLPAIRGGEAEVATVDDELPSADDAPLPRVVDALSARTEEAPPPPTLARRSTTPPPLPIDALPERPVPYRRPETPAAVEPRSPEVRPIEARGTEARAFDGRSLDARGRALDARVADARALEVRALDPRTAELNPEARAPEARAPEARAPEARAPEARPPEARAAEARAPEASPGARPAERAPEVRPLDPPRLPDPRPAEVRPPPLPRLDRAEAPATPTPTPEPLVVAADSSPDARRDATPPLAAAIAPLVPPVDDPTPPPRAVPSTLPRLDPSFLQEVARTGLGRATPMERPMEAVPAARASTAAPLPPPAGPEAAESSLGEPAPRRGAVPPPRRAEPARAEPPPKPTAEAPKPAPRRTGPAPDGQTMAKAARLFEEAVKERAAGNLVSARMNMKLAMTFDPSNALYQQAYDELLKAAPPGTPSNSSKARELYDKASAAERLSRFDEAIELLEKALEEHRDPQVLNRLGVLLAMKRNEFARAQELIESALTMSPGNTTYQHNLSKVLQRAAAHDVRAREGAGGAKKKDGLLGSLLGRRK